MFPFSSSSTTEYIVIITLISFHMQCINSQTYGVDVSFPMHANRASTNYPWLPHNMNPGNISTPQEFVGVPVQPLGDRDSIYDRYMQGCRDYWGDRGSVCDAYERDRIAMNIRQPKSMVVSCTSG